MWRLHLMQRSVLLQTMCYLQVWSTATIISYSQVNFKITVNFYEQLLFLFHKALIHLLFLQQIRVGKLIRVIIVSDIYFCRSSTYIYSICKIFMSILFYNRSTKTWITLFYNTSIFRVELVLFMKIVSDERTDLMNNCLNLSHRHCLQIYHVADRFVRVRIQIQYCILS